MAGHDPAERAALLRPERTTSSQTVVRDYFDSHSRIRPSNTVRSQTEENISSYNTATPGGSSGAITPSGIDYGTLTRRPQSSDSNSSSSSDSSTIVAPAPPTRTLSHLRTASNLRISHNEHRLQPPDLLRGLLVIIQTLDTAALTTNAYRPSLAVALDTDSQKVTRWNRPLPWLLRSLTQFCLPGFMFLLGLSVVYFARSRAQVGWNRWKFIRYFAVRAVILAAINVVLSFVFTGAKPLVNNVVLLSLAINYLIAGAVYLFITFTEIHLTSAMLQPLITLEDEDQARESLLRRGYSFTSEPEDPQIASRDQRNTARTISHHFHNVVLIIIISILFCLPVWHSATKGHCIDGPIAMPKEQNAFALFLLHPIHTEHFSSYFPPIPYLPYTLLGLLYTRVILPRKTAPKQRPPSSLRPGPSPLGFSAGAGKRKPAFWNRSPRRLSIFNLMIGSAFVIFFVLTRILHFGNLSEGCLKTGTHRSHSHGNQYLRDFQSFFYTTTYPPSPSHGFLCMAVVFLTMSLVALVPSPIQLIESSFRIPAENLQMFGQTSLFFFTLHVPVYRLLGLISQWLFGREKTWDMNVIGMVQSGAALYGTAHGSDGDRSPPSAPIIGVSMHTFFIDWLVGLAIMWALCRAYSRIKVGKGSESWWRLL